MCGRIQIWRASSSRSIWIQKFISNIMKLPSRQVNVTVLRSTHTWHTSCSTWRNQKRRESLWLQPVCQWKLSPSRDFAIPAYRHPGSSEDPEKFDKRTSLVIKYTFPKLVSNGHIFITGSSLAQSICYVLQTFVLASIPQLDDYICLICTSVAFKPMFTV